MPPASLSPWRFILAQFVEARRIARNAPASDEGDRTGRATHVDADGIVEDAARSGRGNRPSAETAIFIQPFGHRPVASTDPISRNTNDDPHRKFEFGPRDDRPWITRHVSAECDVRGHSG
jgi:hypothetical protein